MGKNEKKTPNYIVLVHGLFGVKARYRVGAATGAEAEDLVRDFVGDKGNVRVYYRLGEGPLSLGERQRRNNRAIY